MPPNGVRVHGTPGPIQIREQVDRFLVDAPETRLTYRGERVATASAFPGLSVNTARASYRQDGASAEIELILKATDLFVDIVEIDFNSVQRPWWTSPAYEGFTNDDRLAILGKLRELEIYAGEGHTPAEIATKRATLAGELGALADAFNDLILNGETYQALLPVITYTRTVSPVFAAPFVIADIGRVFSTAAMNANVPLNPQFAVSEIINTIAENELQTLGWLKSGRYGISSDGGAQYIQQYTFDAWATARYEFVS